MSALSAPPDRIVSNRSVSAFGMFRGAIADPNIQDLPVYGPFGRLRLKQWQHLAVATPDLAITFAIVDAGYLRLGWIQLVDRKDGTRVEHARQSPWLELRLA